MNTTIFTPFSEEQLIPKEEKLEVFRKEGKLCIGIPKEEIEGENRVPLTPDAVQILVGFGYQVRVESGCGEGAFYQDLAYSEAGAFVVDKKTALAQDLVLKITPPSELEIEMMKPNAYLISALQMSLRNQKYFKKLAQKKITAMAYEFIEDEKGELALIKLIGEIAGSMAILYASELLAKSKGQILGGITGVRPTEVVVLGATIEGESAIRVALGLGASVRVFDNSLHRLRELQNKLGQRVAASMIDPKELTKSLRRADVVIGALPRLNQCPIITEDMVALMKQGSVIVDLTIALGKCIETTELTTCNNPYVEKYGVWHCGMPNITSKISQTTSKAISNFFLNYLLETQEAGGLECRLSKENSVRKSLYMYKGKHTQKVVCDRFDLPFYDINLLLF